MKDGDYRLEIIVELIDTLWNVNISFPGVVQNSCLN